MLDRSVAENRAKQSLVGFPPHVVEAYLHFADGNVAALDTVVLGVLQFYLAKKPATDLRNLPGTTRLIDDLGCDSLTMMDMVFMVESLFEIKIDDAELPQIVTLDDLRQRLREHVRVSGAALQ